MRLLPLGALALGLTACPVVAQDTPFTTGNAFLRVCESDQTWEIACTSYVLGVFHGSHVRGRVICLPDRVDTGQLYQIAISYIRSHPTRSHEPVFGLILAAWLEAFPCRQ